MSTVQHTEIGEQYMDEHKMTQQEEIREREALFVLYVLAGGRDPLGRAQPPLSHKPTSH